MANDPIVRTAAEASRHRFGAALVLDPLREFLDSEGLGEGDLTAEPIGAGHSNLSFVLRRGRDQFVLRRAPRGELSPSANDILRESHILPLLQGTPIPVPEVLARCEDSGVIGAPFFVMSFIEGLAINDGLPADLDRPSAADQIADDTVRTLVDLHAADLTTTGLGKLGRGTGYLERQLRRFGELFESNATRPLKDLEVAAGWLAANLPDSEEATFVHGDYRLGNLLFGAPLHLSAVLDWEMATIGDPLADLGYLSIMWAGPDEEPNPMFALSALTARPGFPSRDALASRYSRASGRSLEDLPWYQVLALWKSAIFLEGSYRRYVAGASTDPYFGTLDRGVPALARAARARIRIAESKPSSHAHDEREERINR